MTRNIKLKRFYSDWAAGCSVDVYYGCLSKTQKKMVSSCFCFIICDNDILLINDPERGFDIPGGHLENGESLSDGLVREIFEETSLVVDPDSFEEVGFIHVMGDGPVPDGHKYGWPSSYQSFFCLYVAEKGELFGEAKDASFIWMDINDALEILSACDREYCVLLQEFLG